MEKIQKLSIVVFLVSTFSATAADQTLDPISCAASSSEQVVKADKKNLPQILSEFGFDHRDIAVFMKPENHFFDYFLKQRLVSAELPKTINDSLTFYSTKGDGSFEFCVEKDGIIIDVSGEKVFFPFEEEAIYVGGNGNVYRLVHNPQAFSFSVVEDKLEELLFEYTESNIQKIIETLIGDVFLEKDLESALVIKHIYWKYTPTNAVNARIILNSFRRLNFNDTFKKVFFDFFAKKVCSLPDNADKFLIENINNQDNEFCKLAARFVNLLRTSNVFKETDSYKWHVDDVSKRCLGIIKAFFVSGSERTAIQSINMLISSLKAFAKQEGLFSEQFKTRLDEIADEPDENKNREFVDQIIQLLRDEFEIRS